MTQPTVTSSVELRSPDSIHPYALNAKEHDDKQVQKIAASIKKFGWRGNPIVVDEKNVILAGHGRRLAAIFLKLPKVPVETVTGMTDDEKRAYRLADNRVAISNIDTDLLQQELATLSFDLDGIFDKKELDFMVADMGELNDDAFVADLDTAIEVQAAETAVAMKEADEKPVQIAKALGFKAIKGADERAVAMFMAQIEADTKKDGADAFMDFIRAFLPVAA